MIPLKTPIKRKQTQGERMTDSFIHGKPLTIYKRLELRNSFLNHQFERKSDNHVCNMPECKWRDAACFKKGTLGRLTNRKPLRWPSSEPSKYNNFKTMSARIQTLTAHSLTTRV